MPGLRIAQFETNIGRARELVGLGQAITGITVGRVDATDLHRAAIVQAVAALDSYVHGMILDYAVHILMGRRAAATSPKVGLDFNAVSDLVTAPSQTDLELRARTHVSERLAKETFQRPDAVAQGFAMVGINRIWSLAYPANPSAIKTSLGVIVERRNQIVHGCDTDPLNPGSVTGLSEADALLAIDTIDQLVHTIDSVI